MIQPDETQDQTAAQEAVGLDETAIVMRNQEQLEIMGVLTNLRDECVEAFKEVESEAQENESLARQSVNYESLICERAERWLDNEGSLGWRCHISGDGAGNAVLLTALSDKLRNRGWEGIEVVSR